MEIVEKTIEEKSLKDLLRGVGMLHRRSFRKLNEGFENEVYDATTEKGEYIIRLRRKGGTSFKQEAWAIEQARVAGLPVASVMLLTEISDDNGKTEVMIQNKLVGGALESIEDGLSNQEMEIAVRSAGDALRKLHAVKVDGFGERHDDGTWQFPDWEAYMQNFIDERREEGDLILSTGVREDEFEDAVGALEEWKADALFKEPVLCHGDFMPRHVFIDDKHNVSGVIDFGLFRGNIPLFDIAYFGFCSPDKFMEPFMAGYESDETQREKLKHSLPFQKLALITKQIGRLAHPYRRAKSAAEIPIWVERLRENLKAMR